MDQLEFNDLGLHGAINILPISITSMQNILTEDYVLKFVGQVAGECYNSSMDDDKCIKRALSCIKRGHHSPWEHVNITLKCTIDRGTSHALVRHRHCAFQQSSTVYQNMSKGYLNIAGLTIVDPCNGKPIPQITDKDIALYNKMFLRYQEQIAAGNAPERARDILPISLATNLIITTNVREYMYIIKRRDGPGDAPRMHIFAYLLKQWFMQFYPSITAAFDEYYKEHPL